MLVALVGAGAAHNLCMAFRRDMPCPCRAREATPASYGDCCGRWHDGLVRGEHAPTPEALMRFRYSAYVSAKKLHEVSRFVREDGSWRHVDGVMIAPDRSD